MAIKTLMGDCPACCEKITAVSAPVLNFDPVGKAAGLASGVVKLANGDSYNSIPSNGGGSRSI